MKELVILIDDEVAENIGMPPLLCKAIDYLESRPEGNKNQIELITSRTLASRLRVPDCSFYKIAGRPEMQPYRVLKGRKFYYGHPKAIKRYKEQA